jgi:TatD DNase family protein
VVAKKCGGVGPAPAADSPLAEHAAAAYEEPPPAGTRWRRAGRSKPPGAHPRHQRPPRGHEPWKAEPGPRRPGDGRRARGAPHRHRAGVPRRAPPPARPSGNGWAFTGAVADQRLPDAAAWGGYPGGHPGRPRAPAVPPKHESTGVDDRFWVDTHCHLDDERMPGGTEAASRPPATPACRMVCVGCDATRRGGDRRRRRHGDVWATVGLHPHDAVNGVDTIVDLLDPGCRGRRRVRPRLPLRPLPARCSARCSPRRSRSPTTRILPLVIHTRDAWDDTFDVLPPRGSPERTIFHCFTGGPTRPGAASTSAHSSASRASSRFRTPTRPVRRGAPYCALRVHRTCSSRPTARLTSLAPVPHRGRPAGQNHDHDGDYAQRRRIAFASTDAPVPVEITWTAPAGAPAPVAP